MEPIIRPAVQPAASPSDHSIGSAKNKTCSSQLVKREYNYYTVRPLPADAISGFASWVQHESWEFVYNGRDSSDMNSRFEFIVNMNLDH